METLVSGASLPEIRIACERPFMQSANLIFFFYYHRLAKESETDRWKSRWLISTEAFDRLKQRKKIYAALNGEIPSRAKERRICYRVIHGRTLEENCCFSCVEELR